MPHDRTRYEGKNLFRLLLALGGPALILYFGNILAFAANRKSVTHNEYLALIGGSRTFSIAFFVVQFGCARYLQRLLRIPSSRLRKAAQYLAVLIACVFLSVSAAIAFQAFGYRLYLAAHRH